MRVALTGLSGRRHPKNSPRESRLAAISLRHKQPKTRPRDGTEKPVRSAVMYTHSRPLVQKVGPATARLGPTLRDGRIGSYPLGKIELSGPLSQRRGNMPITMKASSIFVSRNRLRQALQMAVLDLEEGHAPDPLRYADYNAKDPSFLDRLEISLRRGTFRPSPPSELT